MTALNIAYAGNGVPGLAELEAASGPQRLRLLP